MKKESNQNLDRGQDRLFNFRPIFFSAVFLSLGIFFAYLQIIKGVSSRWLLGLLPCAVMPIFFCKTKERLQKCLLEIAIVGLAFVCGFFSFSNQLANFSDCKNYTGEGIVIGRVVEKREYGSRTEVVLEDLFFNEMAEEGRISTYLSTSYCEKIELSDKLLLRGEISLRTDYVDEFGFRAEDIKDGLCYFINTENVRIVGHDFDLFLYLRSEMQTTIEVGMDETPGAVMNAVLFGDRTGIETELYDNIRMGGVAHIFAVSGLHVGAFFGFCLFLFKKTALRRLPKVVAFCSVATVLLFYAAICGFTPSVLRATIMCLVGYAGSLLFVKTDRLETIALSAIIILFLSPCALFEVGFQLSFAACLGIVLFSKPIGQVCDEVCVWVLDRLPHKATEAEIKARENGDTLPIGVLGTARRKTISFVSVTLAAQLATSPLLLYYYGYLSGWTLLLNCLFVPIFTLAFSLFLLSAVLAFCLPFFAGGILYVSNVVWSLLLLIFQTSDFTSFALSGLKISALSMIPYYAACLFISDKFNLKRPWKILLFFIAFCAFVVCMVALNA